MIVIESNDILTHQSELKQSLHAVSALGLRRRRRTDIRLASNSSSLARFGTRISQRSGPGLLVCYFKSQDQS